ncbi:uncharacterized protein LOC119736547 [Patiria miniata]|uniref:Uncharacterized protein n=1 Tax=Patiria miniata TaxID=46514 RepID=A0A914AS56_PATMI|nr:uncharacterized protein LOC119736547 [Patiria miniata]
MAGGSHRFAGWPQLAAAVVLIQITTITDCVEAFPERSGDFIPPQFVTCPGNIDRTGSVGNATAGVSVSWPPPNATDSGGGTVSLYQTAGLPSGSRFHEGTHFIAYTATDAAGNTATCSFYVQVAFNADYCSSHPCLNGGLCVSATNSYLCVCTTGYVGVRCDADLNECASVPCLNGGVCNDGVGRYDCSCRPGYTGTHCEVYDHASTTPSPTPDPCSPPPCQNGGSCMASLGSYYTCVCAAGSYGANCEHQDPCSRSPCHNGGTCHRVSNENFSCDCAVGFSGSLCENGVDFIPPQFVTCPGNIDRTGSVGNATAGVSVSWPPPNATDSGGGTVTLYQTAGLPSGSRFHEGTHSIAYTAIDAAGNTATCSFYVQVAFNADPCSPPPCLNGGVCTRTGVRLYTCRCAAGFYGANCEHVQDPCSRSPCLNGGTCQRVSNENFSCDCAVGFSGSLCENGAFESCPESIRVTLPLGETHGYVTWAEPELSVGFELGMARSNFEPGSSFAIGHHRVVYMYGNAYTTGCVFYINVVVENTDPYIQDCPQDVQVNLPSGQLEAYVTWSQPQVIGGGGHVVDVVTAGGGQTKPGARFSAGNHELVYQIKQNATEWRRLCSFNVNVMENGAPAANDFYCGTSDHTTTLVLGSILIVAVVACVGLCFLYSRTRRQLSRGGSRSMVPIDSVAAKPKAINNISNFSDPGQRSRYQTNTQQLPPIPLPKPGLVPEDNAYEALDNYGYMCLELQKHNRDGYQLPRAVYQASKGINEY